MILLPRAASSPAYRLYRRRSRDQRRMVRLKTLIIAPKTLRTLITSNSSNNFNNAAQPANHHAMSIVNNVHPDIMTSSSSFQRRRSNLTSRSPMSPRKTQMRTRIPLVPGLTIARWLLALRVLEMVKRGGGGWRWVAVVPIFSVLVYRLSLSLSVCQAFHVNGRLPK